jgi:hypothetical protein
MGFHYSVHNKNGNPVVRTFQQTLAWPGRKKFVKVRANNCCEICFAKASNEANRLLGGSGMEALHIHHIYPMQSFPDKEESKWLILVCQECHGLIEGILGSREYVIAIGRARILRGIIQSYRVDYKALNVELLV